MRPCPDRSQLDTDTGDCSLCRKQVYDLSAMQRDEAEAFLRARAGEQICVSYRAAPDGSPRFRPEGERTWSGALRMLSMGLVLTACAPWGPEELRPGSPDEVGACEMHEGVDGEPQWLCPGDPELEAAACDSTSEARDGRMAATKGIALGGVSLARTPELPTPPPESAPKLVEGRRGWTAQVNFTVDPERKRRIGMLGQAFVYDVGIGPTTPTADLIREFKAKRRREKVRRRADRERRRRRRTKG